MNRWWQNLGFLLFIVVFHSVVRAEIALVKVISIENPICLAQVPEEGGRLFILQRDGRLVACDSDGSSSYTVLEISSLEWDHDRDTDTPTVQRIVRQEVETGAFSVVLRPDFDRAGGVMYLRYVDKNGPPGRWGGTNRVDVIFSVKLQFDAAGNRYHFDDQSVREVYRVPQAADSHNGGWMGFDPIATKGGKAPRFLLYAAYGDDESMGWPNPSDQTRRPQQLDNPYGKILRFEVTPGLLKSDESWVVPVENPFRDVSGAMPEILHVGLRNPWRCGFDRKSGDLWIGDVGNHFEEINVAPAGRVGLNFEWPLRDGPDAFRVPKEGEEARWKKVMKTWAFLENTKQQPPAGQYHLSGGQSIIGGFVYRGKNIKSLQGLYIHSDYFSDRIQWFDPRDGHSGNSESIWDVRNTAAYGEGFDGELYACSFAAGAVFRLVER